MTTKEYAEKKRFIKEFIDEVDACNFIIPEKKSWLKGMLDDCSVAKVNVGIGYLLACKDLGYNVRELYCKLEQRRVDLEQEKYENFKAASEKISELIELVNC